MTLREFRADLHIHTCLSPCTELTMLPTAIVQQARIRGLDIIGISDHNSVENVNAVKKAGKRGGLHVLGGLEIASSEEVHILGFFDDDDALSRIQDIVYENLPGENDEDAFGMQLVVDDCDTPTELNDRLLIGATSLSVEKVVGAVHDLGGLAIASHIDREAFGILGQLGFIPEGLSLDALELSPNCESSEISDYEVHGFPLAKFSDAHYLPDIGKVTTTFLLNAPSVSEIAMAFQGVDGRDVRI